MNENQSPETTVETNDSTKVDVEELTLAQTYARRPFTVQAVRVTENNIGTVASWCGGEVHSSRFAKDGRVSNKSFIKVLVQRPMNEKQTQAFVGDWVLRHSDGSWKVYIDKAFQAIFALVPTVVDIEVTENELKDPSVYGQLKKEFTKAADELQEKEFSKGAPQMMGFQPLPKRLPGEHMHEMLKADAPFTPDNWFNREG